jgi:N-acetylmuramoyl-L-alanine amidase
MKQALLAFVLTMCCTISQAQDFAWETKRIEGRDYVGLPQLAQFYNLPRDVAPADNKIVMSRGARSLILMRDSRDVWINGVKYVLSFPVLDRDGTYWLSRMDLGKTVEPAFRPELVQGIKPFTTVILDAGHGGHDKGAAAPNEFEKNFALDVARRVRNELQNAGMRVIMIRNNDTFIELQTRAALANAQQNAIFVSIHFNAADWNRSANGLEIFAITPRGSPSTEYDELLVRDMVNEQGNKNETQSFTLASVIYHSLQGAKLNMFDRGVKRARFAVLRLTKMPAVLVEGGFLTNAEDAKRVSSTDWRNKYAKAIATGIIEYQKLAELKRVPRTMADYREGRTSSPAAPATVAPAPSPTARPVQSVTLQELPQ